jgi:hypothetical protein
VIAGFISENTACYRRRPGGLNDISGDEKCGILSSRF